MTWHYVHYEIHKIKFCIMTCILSRFIKLNRIVFHKRRLLHLNSLSVYSKNICSLLSNLGIKEYNWRTRCYLVHTPIQKSVGKTPKHKNVHPICQIKVFKYSSYLMFHVSMDLKLLNLFIYLMEKKVAELVRQQRN